MSAVLAIRMGALALAMKAKCGEADPFEWGSLLLRAERTLPEGDPLRACIAECACEVEALTVDDDGLGLAELGDRMHERLIVLSMPVPPGAGRADLHG